MLMRPAVRYVRAPFPANPMPTPMPEIEALIEEHGLLSRILRQRSGDDETAAIGELGEAIAAVDVYCRYPAVDGARRWPTGCRWKAPARRCRSAPPGCSCAR